MSFVSISKKDNLILLDYNYLTNMAIMLRKEILTNKYNKVVKLIKYRRVKK